MNRAPHTLDANDEVGNNLDIMYSVENGWTLLASGARIENHRWRQQFGDIFDDQGLIYELAYGSFEKERFGDFRLAGAFGYQDSEGLRQTVMGEIDLVRHRHPVADPAGRTPARAPGRRRTASTWAPTTSSGSSWNTRPRPAGPLPPSWRSTTSTTNSGDPARSEGPFPAGQITYTISRGGNLNLWFGKRQAGYPVLGRGLQVRARV